MKQSLRLLGLALLFALCVRPVAGDPGVSVIASPSLSQTSIPLSTLRAIYSMRLHRWPDGTPVRVYVFQDDTPEHAAFSKTVLQVFPHQLRQGWDRLVFSGLGQYPEQVASEREMLDKVAATPGAVGYIKTSEINQNVRVLQVR